MKMLTFWERKTSAFTFVLPIVSCSEPTCRRYSINPALMDWIMEESIWLYFWTGCLLVVSLNFISTYGDLLWSGTCISFPFLRPQQTPPMQQDSVFVRHGWASRRWFCAMSLRSTPWLQLQMVTFAQLCTAQRRGKESAGTCTGVCAHSHSFILCKNRSSSYNISWITSHHWGFAKRQNVHLASPLGYDCLQSQGQLGNTATKSKVQAQCKWLFSDIYSKLNMRPPCVAQTVVATCIIF